MLANANPAAPAAVEATTSTTSATVTTSTKNATTTPSSADALIVERVSAKKAQEIFFKWARSEQWNPSCKGHIIAEVYHKTDPEGFFVGKIPNPNRGQGIEDNDEFIDVAIVSALRYGEEQAWVGFYIVDEPYRGHGYGLKVFQAALEHAAPTKSTSFTTRPSIGLDAVMAQVGSYRRSGFTEVGWQNERRNGSITDLVYVHAQDLVEKISRDEVPGLVDLIVRGNTSPGKTVDFDQLPMIEQRYSGMKRPILVQDWVRFHAEHPNEHRFTAAVLSEDKVDPLSGKPVVLGYACVRPAEVSYRIGPLYADSAETAKQLVVKMACDIIQAEKVKPYGTPLVFSVDVPNSNKAAVKLFDDLQWDNTFPCLRMWKGRVPEHDVNGVFGVNALEIG
ncbi:hypothetical protein BGZ83_007612 [Gryganskiella cystojenkinii]|nr:hypothetical protein BGZ83_007612 [Gryganskiella cystojenkinii]